MKSILDFIRYNNAVPIILSVVILGAGAALAASPDLRQAVFAPAEVAPTPKQAKPTDAAALLSRDLGTFDLGIRIDAITEDSQAFHVAYSYRTLEVADGAWKEARKNGEMDIFKGILGKRDFKAYLVEQIGQVIDREIAYLREAKSIAKGDIGSDASAVYASLVGTEIDAETREKSAQNGDASEGGTDPGAPGSSAEDTAVPQSGLSREEINDMIVKAVSDFLAIDTSMPELPAETATPAEPTVSDTEPVGTTEEAPAEEPTPEEEAGTEE